MRRRKEDLLHEGGRRDKGGMVGRMESPVRPAVPVLLLPGHLLRLDDAVPAAVGAQEPREGGAGGGEVARQVCRLHLHLAPPAPHQAVHLAPVLHHLLLLIEEVSTNITEASTPVLHLHIIQGILLNHLDITPVLFLAVLLFLLASSVVSLSRVSTSTSSCRVIDMVVVSTGFPLLVLFCKTRWL